jgi:hypothetical protein
VTELEREVVDLMTNAAEPTWILLQEVAELGGDRGALEEVLTSLETRGMIERKREPSANPDAPAMELDDWWGLTPLGWQSLGRPVPPNYRGV